MYSLKAILDDPHSHVTPEVVAWLANQLVSEKDQRKSYTHISLFIFTDKEEIRLSPMATALLEHFTETSASNWQRALKGIGIGISDIISTQNTDVMLDNASSCMLGHVFLHAMLKDIRSDMDTHIPLHNAIGVIAATDERYAAMHAAALNEVDDAVRDCDGVFIISSLIEILHHDPESNITGHYEKASIVEAGGNEPLYIHNDASYDTEAYYQYAITDELIELGSVISSSAKDNDSQPAATVIFGQVSRLIDGIRSRTFRDRVFEEVTDMMVANLPELPQEEIDRQYGHRTDENATASSDKPLLDLSNICQ